MNIIDILILVVLGFSLLSGMYKGFIGSFLSACGMVGAWFGARALYERVADFALSNRSLMGVLNQYLEPETMFSSTQVARQTVDTVVAGGSGAIESAVADLGERFSFLTDALKQNISSQAFSNLGINSLADYFDQTLWVAVFNVAAFIAVFIVLFLLINLVVNLLNHVIRFPMVRGVDWLLGGVMGLLRGAVAAVLLLCVLPVITSVYSPELTSSLLGGSTLYSFITQVDPLNVAGTIKGLVQNLLP